VNQLRTLTKKRHGALPASRISPEWASHRGWPCGSLRGMAVAEPHRELRFTRAGQATGFWIAGAVLVMAALVFFLLAPHRGENPRLPHPAWGFVPLALAALSIRVAWRCTKHAYILLSPIGVEVFPFFRPEAGMQVIPWAQITGAEVDASRLTLHFSAIFPSRRSRRTGASCFRRRSADGSPLSST
jgi:hypothetical protein